MQNRTDQDRPDATRIVAENIASEMRARGWNHCTLADVSGVDWLSMTNWREQADTIGVGDLERISQALDVVPAVLLVGR